MAQTPGKSSEQIKYEIDLSRDRVGRDLDGLRYELDFPGKIRRSFRSRTALWFGAAVVLGLALTLLPRRTKEVHVDLKPGRQPKKKILEAGFILGALKITASLLRPMLMRFVANKMRGVGGGGRPSHKW